MAFQTLGTTTIGSLLATGNSAGSKCGDMTARQIGWNRGVVERDLPTGAPMTQALNQQLDPLGPLLPPYLTRDERNRTGRPFGIYPHLRYLIGLAISRIPRPEP